MNLRELLDYKLSIKRERLIGRELMIADKPVLMLGLQEVLNEDYYYSRLENGLDSDEEEFHTILYLLYEDEPEDEVWEEEFEEPITRRQLRMEDIETPQTQQVSEVEVFHVGEKSYSVFGMTNGQMLEDFSYHKGHMLSGAAEAGMISGNWLAVDERRLWCCEYILDEEAFNADWDDVSCLVDVILEKPLIEIPVGECFLISPGRDQKPITITIADPKGQLAEVIIYGLRTEMIPGWSDEEGWENHLFIEYEAPESLQMNFFRADYLDAEQPDNEGGVFAMGSDAHNSRIRYDYIDSVPAGFDEPIEVELFSYYIVDQDEEDT